MKTKKRSIKNCKHTWEVVQVLARLIINDPSYRSCKVKTYGPFGLSSSCNIFVEREGEIIGDLEIVYGTNSKFARRTHEKVNNYPPGSIGDLNGWNYKTYDLPLDNEKCLELVFAETEQ